MLKEALEFLENTFRTAAGATLLNIPGDGRKAYVDQDGKLTQFDVSPPVRNHNVNSVADLISAAGKWNAAPVVWISGESIVLISDDNDRRDRVTLKLVKSAAFLRLIALAKDPELTQAELVRTIRIDFQGITDRPALLAIIRNIKFSKSTSGESSIQHGNESLGRTIEAQVSGAGDIPEMVIVNCAVYSNPDERTESFGVGCDLEILTAYAAFNFRPIPDELERVTDAALAGIRDRIEADLAGVEVFFGSP